MPCWSPPAAGKSPRDRSWAKATGLNTQRPSDTAFDPTNMESEWTNIRF